MAQGVEALCPCCSGSFGEKEGKGREPRGDAPFELWQGRPFVALRGAERGEYLLDIG
jgi:hypothetical protein